MSQSIQNFLPNKPFGDGVDGALTISTNTTFSAPNQSCSGASGQKNLVIAAASTFANNDLVLIHQTRGTGVGAWEVNRIASGGGTTTLVMTDNLANTYTDSGSSQAQVVEILRYGNVTINPSINWTTPAWDGNVGGIQVFASNGTIRVAGNIIATGKGFLANTTPATGDGTRDAYRGEGSLDTGGVRATAASGNAGGGGKGNPNPPDTNPGAGGGGGNGAVGTTGGGTATPGAGGGTTGAADLTTATFGGSGGNGGANWPSASIGGLGGNGGGFIVCFAKILIVSGTVAINGAAGTTGDYASGGGGGAGGSGLFRCQQATLGSNLITAAAGAGGEGSYGRGGTNGVGRIRIESCSYSGTTNPTLSAPTTMMSWAGRIGIIG